MRIVIIIISKLKFMKFQIYKNIINKLRTMIEFIYNLEDKYPSLGRYLVLGYHLLYSLKFIIGKKILLEKNRSKYGKLYFNKTYWVNPKKIQYISGFRERQWYNYSRILDGEWDQSNKSFDDLPFYQTSKQRFKEGIKWEDTDLYKNLLRKISNGIILFGIRGIDRKEKLDEMLRRNDSLYYEIKRNGIKSQRELSSSKRWFAKFDVQTILDDIIVDIGRDGQFLLVHGWHRLTIAKLLDIPKVPITIIKRHKKWMDFRKNLISFFRNYQSGKPYQVLSHPDLRNIPFKQGEIPFDIIRENISISNGTLLDIGANLGYFCHKFEDEGFNCYAVEENRMFRYLLKKLKKVENKKFKIIPKSIFEYNKNQELIFDVVLAFNIFHKFLETKDSYLNLIEFLKKLKVKELILGCHSPKEFKNKKFYRNYKPDEFVNFILENSCLNKTKFIGKTKTGRSLYKLTTITTSA